MRNWALAGLVLTALSMTGCTSKPASISAPITTETVRVKEVLHKDFFRLDSGSYSVSSTTSTTRVHTKE